MPTRESIKYGKAGWVRRSVRQSRQPDRLGNFVSHEEVQQQETKSISNPADHIRPPEASKSKFTSRMPRPNIVSSDGTHPKEREELLRLLPRDIVEECGRQGIIIEYDRDIVRNLPPRENRPQPSPGLSSEPAKPTTSDAPKDTSGPWEILRPRVPTLPTETSTDMTVDSSDAIPYVWLPEPQPKPLPESSQSRWVTALIQLKKHRQNLGITADDEHDDEHNDNDSHLRTWCWCERGDIGTESVKCGNPDCSIGWYHKPCLNVYEKWFMKQYELWMCSTCMIPKWKLIIAQERAARVAANDKVIHPAADNAHNAYVDRAGATKHDAYANAGSPDVTDATDTLAAAGEGRIVSTSTTRTDAASANTSVHDASSDALESKPVTSSATDQDGEVFMNNWSEASPPQVETSASCDQNLVGDSNHDVLVDSMAAQAVHESCVIAEPRPPKDVVGPSSTSSDESSTIAALPTTNSRTVIDLTRDDDEQSPSDLIDLTQHEDDCELQGTSSSRSRSLRPAQPSTSILGTRAYPAILNLPSFQAFHQSRTHAGAATPRLHVHAPRPRSISLSVHNMASLQACARLWTSQDSSVRIPQHALQGISLRYKHGETLPSMSSQHAEPRYVLIPSYSSRGVPRGVEIPVKLLNFFSGTLQGVNGCGNLANFTAGTVGAVTIPHADMVLVQNVVEFLKGKALFVTLSPVDIQTTARHKELLLTYAHIAHSLEIKALMKAAMHSLCVSVLRRPQDWSNLDDNRHFLEAYTFPDNPARRLLSGDRPHSILPNVTGEAALPCGAGRRRAICDMRGRGARVMGTWGPPLNLVLAPSVDEERV